MSRFLVAEDNPRVLADHPTIEEIDIDHMAINQGEGREGVETAIHRASPSVMRASRGVKLSNCKQIWLRVHDPSEGMLKLLLYKILLV